jgi:hypothetical protein
MTTFPLGRHVEHDPRSLDFPAPTGTPGSHHWPHHGTVLNQGQLGSCTGNASAQCLVTGPNNQPGRKMTEAKAVKIYELATELDNVTGAYPPDDTGSTGIAAAKACQQLGYITSYTHVFGINHALGAIAMGPMICGTRWDDAMFTPTADGYVVPGGKVAGGHEYLCLGYDQATDSFEFLNSWGTKWGVDLPNCDVTHGGFRMTRVDFASLLDDHGDCTVFH